MLKAAASGVLASLRGSTYRSVRLTSSLTAALVGVMRVLALGWVRTAVFLNILGLEVFASLRVSV